MSIDTHLRPLCFVTTSANQCKSIEKYGLLDLKKSYLCHESELRTFLNGKGIEIDIDNRHLIYKDKAYDITYGTCPSISDSKAYARWSVGRKIYYDYTVCGFLSVWEGVPYGGYIHYRPEILYNIDDLLGLALSQEWYISHEPYEVVATALGREIVYDGDDYHCNKDKIINYLTKAYNAAFGSTQEEIVLLKNDVYIPPNRIIEINPLTCW